MHLYNFRFGRHAAVALVTAVMLAAPVRARGQSLPLGDGHVTTHPAVGNVYSCNTSFRGGGARHAGDWFHGDSWNPLEKPHVSGNVFWPDASVSLTRDGDAVKVAGNGLPVREPTGSFPISPSDSAYRYDTNPNHIAAQHLNFDIPASPQPAGQPGCLPMGMIGFTTTGVAFYNALDDAGRDAAAHEVQDNCDGHPQSSAQYHYHNGSPCIPGYDRDTLVGWALDGYPILGMKSAAGQWITNADLDACHGRAERVTVEGRSYGYAYRLTREYPYTIGCFTGRLLPGTEQAIRQGLNPSWRRRPGARSGRGGRGRGGEGG